ncbi:frizzled-9b [Pseudoliparis swirei]|uniref:frizzled-9b n=1 Tax=Pseudoliparis swirei TaxID=2059687 RepID=UPI0024BE28AB|nr:frizzled-9b [Pseudoliparis swirei]
MEEERLHETRDSAASLHSTTATHGSLNAATHGSLNAATHGSLNAATDGSLNAATHGSLNAATHGSLNAATHGSLNAATHGSLNEATDGSLNAATHGSLNEATDGSLNEATDGSLNVATDRSLNGSLKAATDRSLNGSKNGSLNRAMDGSKNASLNPAMNGSLTRSRLWSRTGSLLTVLACCLLAAPGSGFEIGSYDAERGRPAKCEPVSIPMCAGIGYNLTRMPNFLNHGDQREAAAKLHEFAPLVAYGCDAQLRFFLCSLYAPMCTDKVSASIPACRPMCEAARRRCAPIMKKFSYTWPDALDCSRLPTRNDPNALCMEAPENETRAEGKRGEGMLPVAPRPRQPAGGGGRAAPGGSGSCENPDKFQLVEKSRACAPRCSPAVDVLWSRRDKAFALVWMAVWAALCFASTAFTVLTFLLEPQRFQYPERPIIFLSMCYNVYSVAFVIRLAAGAENIACDREHGESYIIQEGLESTGCTLVFLLLYYFGMASSIWWVVLTLTWFLAAGRKWGHEAIEAHGNYFHMAAWGVPALKTIVILTMRKVAGDELTGLCYVGGADAGALTGFVLIPLSCYLVIGTSFLLAGFVALFHIRKVMKTGGSNTEKLEKLMVKIGIYSILYTVPATCVLVCYFYERLNMDYWRRRGLQTPCGGAGCSLRTSVPAVAVFMLKIFMSLVVGITSGVWVWSSKTLQTWQNLCSRKLTERSRGRKPGGGATNCHFKTATGRQDSPTHV